MSKNIFIPKLGMTMSEARIVEWRVKEGEWVKEDQIVLLIETDKVTYEINAPASGFLHILAESETTLKVGDVAGVLAETKEELAELQKSGLVTGKQVEKAKSTVSPDARVKPRGESRVKISPLAKKMAEEHKIEIASIQGSGPGQRITRSDIEKAIEEQKERSMPREEASFEVYQGKRVKEAMPLKGMRRTIAEHMYSSLSNSAQMTIFGEFNATELVKFRENLIDQEKSIGLRITYTEILVFAIARALKNHPDINSSLIDDEIKVWEDINIGVAVALGKEGLIVPVVKNADQKSLIEISKLVKELIEKARAGKVMPDDVTGGTFTLTSVGGIGFSYFQTPILNQPEAAILGTAPIKEKPVVRDGQIIITPVMPCSLTVDHRLVNGFGAELFLGRLGELLENPSLLLI